MCCGFHMVQPPIIRLVESLLIGTAISCIGLPRRVSEWKKTSRVLAKSFPGQWSAIAHANVTKA